MTQRPTALITGPTAGIGRAYADHFASLGHDLVLVSRDRLRLEEVAAELREQHGVEVEVLAADLAVRKQLLSVESRLRDRTRPIDVLVNNAGFGINARFSSGKVDDEQHLLDVLVTAVMRLTHAAVGGMVERGHGDIVVVSSVAGFIAGSTYSAVKSWATVFCEALNNELQGSGVTVSALCPGFTRTEFHERAGMDMRWLPAFMWLDANRLVELGWRDHQLGRVVSVPGWQYKFLVWLTRTAPRSLVRRAGFSFRHGKQGRGVAAVAD